MCLWYVGACGCQRTTLWSQFSSLHGRVGPGIDLRSPSVHNVHLCQSHLSSLSIFSHLLISKWLHFPLSIATFPVEFWCLLLCLPCVYALSLTVLSAFMLISGLQESFSSGCLTFFSYSSPGSSLPDLSAVQLASCSWFSSELQMSSVITLCRDQSVQKMRMLVGRNKDVPHYYIILVSDLLVF